MINHRSRNAKSKRGKHTYLTFRQVKEKFGLAQAKFIRDKKYELENNRDPNDTTPAWWAPHPEVPNDKDLSSEMYIIIYIFIIICILYVSLSIIELDIPDYR